MDELDSFVSACEDLNLKKLDDYIYRYETHSTDPTLFLSGLIHGDEVGGLFILNSILHEISVNKPQLNIIFSLGNIKAYVTKKRYIGTDLNRSFGSVELKSEEYKRAQILKTFLSDVDVLIDFHQTIQPVSHPFFLFPFSKENMEFAIWLDPHSPKITYKSSKTEGLTFTGAANQFKAKALTIETGQKGFEQKQISYGLSIFKKALSYLTTSEDQPQATDFENVYTWSQVVSNHDHSLKLIKEFKNFEVIKKDEILAEKSDGTFVKSPIDGFIMFPKLGKARFESKELVCIIKPVSSEKDLD